MAGALYIPGADRSTRWFLDNYPSQATFTRLEKTLLHSTETPKTGSCPGYSSGGMAPTVTINPWPGYQKVWQHFPLNRSARALGNPSSTPVSENKDNVFQVEIIGYSDPGYGRQYGCYLPDLPDAGLDYLVKMLAFVHKEWPHSTKLPSTWPLYKVSSYASMDAAHMSSSAYDSFNGILAHLHAPKPSSHGDVAIKIQTVKKKLDAALNPPAPTPTPTPDPGTSTTAKEAFMLVRVKDTAPVWFSTGVHRRWVQNPTDLAGLQRVLKATGHNSDIQTISAAELSAFGEPVGKVPA